MSFAHDVKDLRRAVAWWFVLFILFGFAFFLLPPGESAAVWVFGQMKADLIPSGVELVVMNPMTAFFAQFQIAFALALLVSFPYLVWRLLAYALPALYPHERRAFLWFLFPSFLLFFGGNAFAYWILIPSMFRVLYAYAPVLGAESLFALSDFIGLSLGLAIATGLAFLLPIGMVLLTKMGIVRSEVWARQWRKGLVAFLVVSALITPDGSGISMVLLSIPLFALYLSGAFLSSRVGA